MRPGVARPLHLIHGGASSYCARQSQSSPAATHRNRLEAWPLDRRAFGGTGALRGGALARAVINWAAVKGAVVRWAVVRWAGFTPAASGRRAPDADGRPRMAASTITLPARPSAPASRNAALRPAGGRVHDLIQRVPLARGRPASSRWPAHRRRPGPPPGGHPDAPLHVPPGSRTRCRAPRCRVRSRAAARCSRRRRPCRRVGGHRRHRGRAQRRRRQADADAHEHEPGTSAATSRAVNEQQQTTHRRRSAACRRR